MNIRHFIAIAVLAAGGFAFAGPLSTEGIPDAGQFSFGGDTDIDHDGVLVVEVADPSAYVIPTADHGDVVNLLELRAHSAATHMDLAGVERTAAGRPIDAAPGSLDAALTGMQHDAAGTVRNTVSPEPTPSSQVQQALAEDPEMREQPAPSAQEPLEDTA